MAKTEILTKDGLTIYDEKIKDYIKEKIDDTVYIDPDETSSDLPDIDAVTSAKYVSYNNADSNLEATNVQEAIDELKESIGSGSGETVNIVDNLESTATDSALSANQGRVLNEKVDEVNTYLQRSKNLLKINVDESAFSELGSSIIVNDDKSITHSGTHTVMTNYWYIGRVYLKANTEYILSGCPAGGSLSTYALKVETASYALSSEWVADTGEGVRFSVEEEGYYNVDIMLKPGINYDGITYYPMIREATVEDDTYEPYYEDAMSIVNNALVHGDVVDNLESTATDLPISANQVRIVNEKIKSQISPLFTKNTSFTSNKTWEIYIRTGNGRGFQFFAESHVEKLTGTYLYEFDLVLTITYDDVNDNYGNPTLSNDRNVVVYAKYPIILTDGAVAFNPAGGEYYGLPKANGTASSGSLIENIISFNLNDIPSVTMPYYLYGKSDRVGIQVKFNEGKTGSMTLNVYRSKEPIPLGY